jgi:hypothetical protein
MVRHLLRLVAALALAAGALFTVSGPACACSCMPNPNMSERVAKADAVFVGRLVDTKTNGQSKTLTLAVDTVYKGNVSPKQEIVTPRDSAGCGLEIQGKEPWIVFGSAGSEGMTELKVGKGQYSAILCGGADPVTAEGTKQLGAVKGLTPSQVKEDPPPAQPVVVDGKNAKPQAAPSEQASTTPLWPWATGAALLLALGGGLIWWRAARSRA